MQLIQCNSQAWTELTAAMARKKLAAGVRIIQGSSPQLTKEVQALLNAIDNASIHYLLFSSDSYFYHPGYATLLAGGPAEVEDLDAFHVMNFSGLSMRETREVYTPQYALEQLQQQCAQVRSGFQLIMLEYLTPPTKNDLLLIKKLLWSTLVREMPIFIFIHEAEEHTLESTQDYQTDACELLAYLYIAGGRIRAAEWWRLPPVSRLNELISTRTIGSSVWITYRDHVVATAAQKIFHGLSQTDQRCYARKLLQVLPAGILYPLLAISRTTADLASLLGCYTSLSLKCALVQPLQVLAYFRTLRHLLKQQDDPMLLEAATINYLSTLLCCYRSAPTRVYQFVQRHESYFPRAEVKARFLFILGQVLVQSQDTYCLQAAADCFQKSRAYLCALETLDQYERASRLASLYNGEALIALKLQRPEMALQLEEKARHELQTVADAGLTSINIQHILFLTHSGDVYRRKLGDCDTALLFYKQAYAIALTNSSLAAQIYIMPRLADTLIQAKRDQEAIPVLENLWHILQKQQKLHSESNTMAGLKTSLVLAQIYMQQGLPRKAAFYYWILLRQSAWLKPAIVRGIVANVQQCRPRMPAHLHKYAMRIIALQELAMHDAARIEACFKTRGDGSHASLLGSEPESV